MLVLLNINGYFSKNICIYEIQLNKKLVSMTPALVFEIGVIMVVFSVLIGKLLVLQKRRDFSSAKTQLLFIIIAIAIVIGIYAI